MSFFSQSIVKKSKEKLEIKEAEMIFRNMTGEVLLCVVVLKTAFFTDVRAYVAQQMGLKYCETRLIVNEEEPDGLRQIESLPSLNSRIMVDLLVDKEETEFDCPLCHQRRDISQCREWEQLHANRCIPCRQGGHHMCCWLDVEDDEDNHPELVE
jgi:hypothetical protein